MDTEFTLSSRARTFLIHTVQRLGAQAVESYRGNILVEEKKNPHDVVTEVDRWLQHQLEKHCTDFLPDSTVFGEEAVPELTLSQVPDHFGEHLGDKPLWIIDPIDGTSNFVHGFSFFALSIALWHSGKIVAAVVHNPVVQETFSADLTGAYFASSNTTVPTLLSCGTGREQSRAALSTSFPHAELLVTQPGVSSPAAPAHLNLFARLVDSFASVRRPICASLEMSYVAAGFSDATLAVDSKPWDAAAGSFIAAQAGATLRPYWYGEPKALPDFAAPCYTVTRGDYPVLVQVAQQISELQRDTLGLSSMNRPK